LFLGAFDDRIAFESFHVIERLFATRLPHEINGVDGSSDNENRSSFVNVADKYPLMESLHAMIIAGLNMADKSWNWIHCDRFSITEDKRNETGTQYIDMKTVTSILHGTLLDESLSLRGVMERIPRDYAYRFDVLWRLRYVKLSSSKCDSNACKVMMMRAIKCVIILHNPFSDLERIFCDYYHLIDLITSHISANISINGFNYSNQSLSQMTSHEELVILCLDTLYELFCRCNRESIEELEIFQLQPTFKPLPYQLGLVHADELAYYTTTPGPGHIPSLLKTCLDTIYHVVSGDVAVVSSTPQSAAASHCGTISAEVFDFHLNMVISLLNLLDACSLSLDIRYCIWKKFVCS